MAEDHRPPPRRPAGPARPSRRSIGLGLGAPAVLATWWWTHGHWASAVALVVVAIVVSAARVASKGVVDARFRWAAARFASLLTGLVLGAVYALVVVPLWAVRRVTGRRRRRAAGESRWSEVPDWRGRRSFDARSFLPDRAPISRTRSLAWAVPSLVGWLVILLALDLLVGSVWDASNHHRIASLLPPSADFHAPVGGAPINLTGAPPPRDPRIDLPALASSPWRFTFFSEMGAARAHYEPYLLWVADDAHGRYVNIQHGIRRSYEPRIAVGRPAPTVLFSGGSTTWGEGQRDLHTIPSEVARLAERAGLPLHAVNVAQRGWTAWQELFDYSNRLSAGPAPDLAVFYDGFNEVATQRSGPPGQPAQYEAAHSGDVVSQLSGGLGSFGAGSAAAAWAFSRDFYARHSALDKVARAARSVVAVAGARRVTPPGADATDRRIGQDAWSVYARARALMIHLSAESRVDALYFWQPVRPGDPAEDVAAAAVQAPTVNLAHLLDQQPVFIDDGHTNERGAALVAAAIWERLEPRVAAWYRRHG